MGDQARENKLEVRFYEKEYPEKNEMVMVSVPFRIEMNEFLQIAKLENY